MGQVLAHFDKNAPGEPRVMLTVSRGEDALLFLVDREVAFRFWSVLGSVIATIDAIALEAWGKAWWGHE